MSEARKLLDSGIDIYNELEVRRWVKQNVRSRVSIIELMIQAHNIRTMRLLFERQRHASHLDGFGFLIPPTPRVSRIRVLSCA